MKFRLYIIKRTFFAVNPSLLYLFHSYPVFHCCLVFVLINYPVLGSDFNVVGRHSKVIFLFGVSLAPPPLLLDSFPFFTSSPQLLPFLNLAKLLTMLKLPLNESKGVLESPSLAKKKGAGMGRIVEGLQRTATSRSYDFGDEDKVY